MKVAAALRRVLICQPQHIVIIFSDRADPNLHVALWVHALCLPRCRERNTEPKDAELPVRGKASASAAEIYMVRTHRDSGLSEARTRGKS